MPGKRPYVRDEIKRGRALLPKILVVLACSAVIDYVMDNDILAAFMLMLVVYVMLNQRNKVLGADWKPPNSEEKSGENSQKNPE